jgi:hypothetical protein
LQAKAIKKPNIPPAIMIIKAMLWHDREQLKQYPTTSHQTGNKRRKKNRASIIFKSSQKNEMISSFLPLLA